MKLYLITSSGSILIFLSSIVDGIGIVLRTFLVFCVVVREGSILEPVVVSIVTVSEIVVNGVSSRGKLVSNCC